MNESPYSHQSGALPYRWKDSQLEVLVITSRRTGKWGIPKGNLEIGLDPAESAQQEAWEEAGLTGTIDYEAIGTYTYTKYHRTYLVEVYPLHVQFVHDTWLEEEERSRQWMTHSQACNAIQNLLLREIVRSLPQYIQPYEDGWP